MKRPEKTRKLRRILIVCEGKKTEPNYFKKFKTNPEVFDDIDVQGIGYNTVSLITEAIKIKEAKKNHILKPGVSLIKTISLLNHLRKR